MDMALQILDQMKSKAGKPDEEIYRRLIEACGHCGLKDRVLQLFKRMKNQGIEPDACTHGVYVKAVAEGQERNKHVNLILALNDLPPGSLCLTLDLDNSMFVTDDKCPTCNIMVTQDEIFAGWERSYSNYTTKCSNADCMVKFPPRFQVLIDPQTTDETVDVEFLSPPVLRKEFENLMYTNGEDVVASREFCDQYKVVFWNMSMYFRLFRLPDFFINPTFDSSNLSDIIQHYLRAQKRTRDRSPKPDANRRTNNFSAVSDDDNLSDNGSYISGYSNFSSHSQNAVLEAKLQFMSTSLSRTKSRSSNRSDVSTRSANRGRQSMAKILGGYIDDFKAENYDVGVRSSVFNEDD